MPSFWLDADALIRPNRDGFYSLQLVPTFWQFLERKANEGVIAIPRRVYQELADYGDNLADWVSARQQSGLFVDPDQDVSVAMTRVSDYVVQNYQGYKAQEFLGGADPWVIAHAVADGGSTIVTYESRVSLSSQTPKIPNIAQAFQVQTVNLFRMLQMMGATLEFRG